MSRIIDRRDFIKSAAATGAALGFLPGTARVLGCPFAGEEAAKSRVVEVVAPGTMINVRTPEPDRVRAMIDTGILALTGESTLAAAWRCFVKPDDVVGIKVNGAGMKLIGTHLPILAAVIDGVRAAGVPDGNIVVWEQVKEHFYKYYLHQHNIHPEKDEGQGGVRYEACTPKLSQETLSQGAPLPGYETEPVKFPWGEIKVAELVANTLTAIINLPVLKDHACAGVTLSLKNISHASVNTPWFCHANACDPYIADIVSIPAIRNKLRLHILDALVGQAEGSPRQPKIDHLFVKDTILLSRDPVAVDTLGLEWITAARAEMKLPPLEEADNPIADEERQAGQEPSILGRPAHHIATAAARGLGTNDRSRMEIVKLHLPPPAEDAEEQEEEGS